jgi:hypothetical protein
MDELYNNFGDFHKRGVPNLEEKRIRLAALDLNGDGYIDKNEFMLFLELIRIVVKEQVDIIYMTLHDIM